MELAAVPVSVELAVSVVVSAANPKFPVLFLVFGPPVLALRSWLFSRRLRPLLFGLPALLLGVAVVTLLVLSFVQPTLAVENRYLNQGKSFIRSGKWDQALTCYDHLAHAGAAHPEYLYGLAVTLYAKGQHERAQAIMNQLAQPDTNGYPRADIWQARRQLGTPGNLAEARNRAKAHLLRALDGELEDPDEAHALLGEIYLAENQLDKAEPHLMKAIRTRPTLRLRLAQLYVLRGNKERAEAEAKLAADYFSGLARSDLQDHAARIHWADALAFLEQFPQSIEILKEGLTATQEPVYRSALAGVFLVWSDFLGARTRPTTWRNGSICSR